MFTISHLDLIGRKVVSTFDTFNAAMDYANNVMLAQYFEIDSDYPNCADFVVIDNNDLQVYAIQPVDFKL